MNARTLLRRLVLLGTPLILVVVGLIHPQGSTLGAMLAQADLMFVLHLLLIPVFSLIGLAGTWLTTGMDGRAARISRSALVIFVILYIAYDVVAGVASGAYFAVAQGLPAEQQTALYQASMAVLTSTHGLVVFLAFFGVGTLAWIIGMIAAAVALGQAGAAREPRILLLLAGVLLLGDHSNVLGAVAFGCFFLAAAWLEFAPQLRARRQPAALNEI